MIFTNLNVEFCEFFHFSGASLRPIHPLNDRPQHYRPNSSGSCSDSFRRPALADDDRLIPGKEIHQLLDLVYVYIRTPLPV